jgi:saccharopine dehydrogenase-like NADP-dependent oxidoreductase
MKDKILVIGGYGQVGMIICKDLGKKFPGKVIVAGRSYDKAEKFTKSSMGDMIPLEFDAFANYDQDQIWDDISTVVMCIDQRDTKLVESCLRNNVNYVDITASFNFLSKVQSLNIAKTTEATGILSVGLTPGLTNLLVKYSKSHFDHLDRADISVMLGLGEEHGRAAIEWMVDNVSTSFEVVEKGKLKKVKSFEDGKKTNFPKNLGQRIVYRFNLAEQHILPKTLGIKTVSNRVCFDSRFITKVLAFLKKVGFFNLLKIKSLRNVILETFERINFGSEVFCAKVDALGKKNGKISEFKCSILGNNQSRITGKVAAAITEHIYTKNYPNGVYHIEEIFSIEDIMDQISQYINFYHD